MPDSVIHYDFRLQGNDTASIIHRQDSLSVYDFRGDEKLLLLQS
jgi:hypothetical protein